MSNNSLRQRGFALFGIVMVVATITLVGLVAFQFLEAQDNTQVATSERPKTVKVTDIETTDDIDAVTEQLDTTELDALDAELSAQFDF